MSANTINHRHAISLLILFGTILLVAAAWGLPDNGPSFIDPNIAETGARLVKE
jgi:hypothetical protein